ncbi:chondroitin sulfate ABC exolyase-like [Oculina patagonica]
MYNFVVFQRLCYLLFTVFITHIQATSSTPCLHNQRFDFEPAIPGQKGCFLPIPSSSGSVTLSTDPKTVKSGTKSLKWTATGASTLQLKTSTFTIPNSWLRHGGVKVWIYKDSPSSGKSLGVQFKRATTTTVGSFSANLNFKGWRGIWVKFAECKSTASSLAGRAVIDEVNFVLTDADTIYIDALEFQKSLSKQSRDKVVPPISPYGLAMYDKSNFWQQTYKWSQQAVPASPTTIDEQKRKSLNHIKNRLKNYYCDEEKATTSFPSGSFLKKRWDSLLETVDKAHGEYDKLTFSGGKIVGPPLFCRNCKLGKKFGFIFETVLLPLALEYHIRSRTDEVTNTATKQLADLNSGNSDKVQNAQIAIAGQDSNMRRLFVSYLPSARPLTVNQVKAAINTLNLVRLNKINDLLDYVKQQGFADGSGVGSLDHEMNKDSAGFMHTLFLLSDSLSVSSNKSRLLDLISTAKWYNDFGEIYQTPTFEFKGTTADRMITLLLYRLIIVLVMPSDNDNEKKAKLRDMDALLRWMNNAVSVNEGLGGVIKPDFTGFHHKGFYASSYVPQALHNAAFVQYLLGGTSFALSSTSTNNIRRALETLRLVAVKYSTPTSVNGRYPGYFNKKLIKTLLAGYAYISVSHPSTSSSTMPTGIRVSDLNRPQTQMFLRLYKDSTVNDYLEDGKPKKSKYYYNSLGSLQIMEAVKYTAVCKGISAEPSPEGHWSKNFAALSIHRRKDWAVTVKGFNRFVWDIEASGKENVYGLFASHGALLIANSEDALKVHDVDHGWDWAKTPGTTTIAMGTPNINDLNIGAGRFYNRRKLAGSVTFKGTMTLKNGLFGMSFLQPDYGFSSSDWRKRINFRFKKSVFSFENLLVCLGSNIRARHTNGKVIQTTLFQDKLASGDASSFIKVGGAQKTASSNYNHVPSASSSYTTLTDAKGNFYYIPSPSKSILHVTVKSQSSKSDNGKKDTSGIYGTAWFQHVRAQPKYQYAVLIPTTSYHTPLTDIATAQETTGSEVYKVLQHDSTAHVVQFLKSPKTWSALSAPITGYVIFVASRPLPSGGPVASITSGDCLIMVQETTGFIYLGISSPDLNFDVTGTDPVYSGDVGEELLYNKASVGKSVTVTLRKQVTTTIAETQVHVNPNGYTPNVEIGSNGKDIKFKNLKNGFSVEVKLTRV